MSANPGRLFSLVYHHLAATLACAGLGLAASPASFATVTSFETEFAHPSPQNHPFVRWWWNGNRVNSAEAIRQLDVLQAAGIGGVEINSIAMPESVPSDGLRAFPQHRWLSPAWGEVVREVALAAQDRGMTADIIIGSGWPFGGEFLPLADQIQRVRLVKRRFEGPAEIDLPLADLHIDQISEQDHESAHDILPPERELLAMRLRAPGDAGLGTTLSSRPGPLPDRVTFSVPEGPHDLYLVLREQGYTEVKHGAPGAAGPIVDHYNPDAVSRYLQHMDEAFRRATGRPWADLVRAVFIDSIELSRSNWTTGLAGRFREVHDYDVTPYLHLVLDNQDQPLPPTLADRVQRVRYDFTQLLVDTFEHGFLKTVNDWALANGIQARAQAYGRETHPLHGSMSVSLPEGETWLWNDRLTNRDIRVDSTSVNGYVGSAARLAGQRLVSFEAMTNAVPVFRETLADFKQALDYTLLEGIGHPIIHGFNYTPREAGFPGWVRFGCYLNERTPWWPHLPHFSAYSARMNTVLQAGEIQARIALLGPRADELGRHGMLYQPFPETKYPWYHYAMARAFREAGYGVDFISERILTAGQISDGQLHYGPRSYDGIVMMEVDSISQASAKALRSFANAGGQLAAIGAPPSRHAGLSITADRDGEVQAQINQISADHLHVFAAPIKPPSPYEEGQRGAPAHDQGLIDLAGEIGRTLEVEPNVRWSRPQRDQSQIRLRLDDGRDAVFFVNSRRDTAIHVATAVPGVTGNPLRWDPATGKKQPQPQHADGSLDLRLGPLESALVIWESGTETKRSRVAAERADNSAVKTLANWSARFSPVADSQAFVLPRFELQDLSEHPDNRVASFGGQVTYRTEFEADADARRWLDLGVAQGSMEVRLNGELIGTSWYGRGVYDLSGYLLDQTNTLEITLATHLANYMKAQTNDPVAQRWTFWFPPIPAGLIGPVTLSEQIP
jgi:hypothetical protein